MTILIQMIGAVALLVWGDAFDSRRNVPHVRGSVAPVAREKFK